MMDNQQKKGILTIVGLGLSMIGTVVSFASSKVDDAVQTEKIDTAVNNKIDSIDFSQIIGK